MAHQIFFIKRCKLTFEYRGEIAQLVEQRIENPRVPGSSPGLATMCEGGGIGRHARLRI